jgi:hypothetical protein
MTTKKVRTRKFQENWLERKWRPAMGWMYFTVCVTDFILFPIVWSAFMAHYGNAMDVWDPLTLQGGGLFHVAMGAVLGVAAWTRGQEKIVRYQQGYVNYDDDDDIEIPDPNATAQNRQEQEGFYRYRG